MTTTQQDLHNYRELFGEPGLDRTSGHTGVLLATFSADAANTSTPLELLAQASTSLDPLAFLLAWENQVHVLHNIFQVRASLTIPNAYCGAPSSPPTFKPESYPSIIPPGISRIQIWSWRGLLLRTMSSLNYGTFGIPPSVPVPTTARLWAGHSEDQFQGTAR